MTPTSTRKKIIAADLFCGAGGTSTGLQEACDELGLDLDLVAVNHWPTAIDTHSKNHPNAKHLCASLDGVNPREVVPGGRLHLLCASPECTHFSNARGGKPVLDQKRTPAFVVLQWLEALYVDNFVIENVPEFMNWGPLSATGKPIKKRRGETFRMFIKSIESLDYKVEYRILTCADYGDPTTRKRLFIMGRKRRAITWPEPTHSRDAAKQPGLFAVQKPWVAARNIIDWNIVSPSIFTRKKPLANTTLKRIEAGLRKFAGKNAEPFLVVLRNHMAAQGLDEPAPTVTAGGTHIGVCEPSAQGEIDWSKVRTSPNKYGAEWVDASTVSAPEFLLGQQSGSVPRSVDEPVMTVAGGGAISLTEASFIVPNFGERDGQEPRTHSVDDPLPTVTGHGAGCLVETRYGLVEVASVGGRDLNPDAPMPDMDAANEFGVMEFVVTAGGPEGQGRNARSVDQPLTTVLTDPRQSLVSAQFLVTANHGTDKASPDGGHARRAKSVDDPLHTITGAPTHAVVEAHAQPESMVFPLNRTKDDPRPTDRPLMTVTATSNDLGLAEFIVPLNHGSADTRSQSCDEPMKTITSFDAWGLVEPNSGMRIDIRFRMLRPHELARAQGFPDDYVFKGTRDDQVKQIGNAVPCKTAKALTLAALSLYSKSSTRKEEVMEMIA